MPNYEHNYKQVMAFNIFKQTDEDKEKDRARGTEYPKDYGNWNVEFANSLPAGRYSISGWAYSDTGNIRVTITKVEPNPDYDPKEKSGSPGRDSNDDSFGGFGNG